MVRQRKHHTAQEKMAILRRHLVEKTPVSELCDELGIQPTIFYRWQKELFEQGAMVFERNGQRRSNGPSKAEQRKIDALEAKLRQKNEVLAELMSEHVALKKSLGEL
jgi:transposase